MFKKYKYFKLKLKYIFNILKENLAYEPMENYHIGSGIPYKRNGIMYNMYEDIQVETLDEDDRNAGKAFRSYRFKLNDVEVARLKKFTADHAHKDDLHLYKPVYDKPRIWLGESSGGGIGTCISCRCEVCGEVCDITDINDW